MNRQGSISPKVQPALHGCSHAERLNKVGSPFPPNYTVKMAMRPEEKFSPMDILTSPHHPHLFFSVCVCLFLFFPSSKMTKILLQKECEM